MRYWLCEALDRSGAVWGFLVHADAISAAEVAEQLRTSRRGIEISGQLVETSLLDLTSLRVKYDATDRHKGPAGRFTIHGDRVR